MALSIDSNYVGVKNAAIAVFLQVLPPTQHQHNSVLYIARLPRQRIPCSFLNGLQVLSSLLSIIGIVQMRKAYSVSPRSDPQPPPPDLVIQRT